MSTWENEPEEDRAAESVGGSAGPDHVALPLEADEADVIEQTIPAGPAPEGDGTVPPRLDVPLEATEADVIDQALPVVTDDDDE